MAILGGMSLIVADLSLIPNFLQNPNGRNVSLELLLPSPGPETLDFDKSTSVAMSARLLKTEFPEPVHGSPPAANWVCMCVCVCERLSVDQNPIQPLLQVIGAKCVASLLLSRSWSNGIVNRDSCFRFCNDLGKTLNF